MQELEKILEEIIDQLKEEGCIIDDAAGNRAEEIIRKHMKEGSKKGMGYKNPVPSIDDVMLCKKFYISKTFTFNENVTLKEAAKGIGRLIQENEGEIPADWIGFADRPKAREECGWWNGGELTAGNLSDFRQM